MTKADDELISLFGLNGRTICRIRRIRYVLRGEVISSDGPMEFSFTDDFIVLLDAGPDGEALAVKAAAWTDHFAEPLSNDNREFVEQSGKWTAFDVSAQEPYLRLVGEPIQQVVPVRTPENKISGVALTTPAATLRVETQGDQVTVDIA